ncbi:lipocalin family protein [Brevundimonas subvibrioides]|uniref:Outer membrane lipoprotein Blc n=1 Tax=Brevundimonas subvibrioides (strain ATCC 15264 / DSM 4735 / LMG 14903 / NBRC 16000 / CB 81) TaxID=633149 RepID=D9QFE3_BRESC|nr:lipocalin family protein [Brevundimonas subvibrioides]ADL02458.1 Lipocalin family protein [Brevundimonas subvibrioides ATCC 15264]
MSRKKYLSIALATVAVVGLAACATAIRPEQVRAPQPARAVDAERLYSGRWLEIGRLPMRLTDGCVAGASSYELRSPTTLALRDTCQSGTPTGKEKAIGADATILDPGTNAKFRARYFAGFVTWEYWILDHDDDYTWFISADPTFDKLWIYTREVPSPDELAQLVARAEALGYDTSRLEFPPTA